MHTILSMAAAMIAVAAQPPTEATPSPFQERGYYITFMRMPTYNLATWKHIIDGIHDDGGNLLLLWMGGAFRSKKFPITWKYNEEHQNVRQDFVRDLIDHAHTKGIRVLLGFTPFGYDGVNQYPLEHPEFKAVGRDGKPVSKFGIGCWGYNNVVLFVFMFMVWAWMLSRWDFTPLKVLLLFGITGSLAEATINPTSLIGGFWVFVYGLMVYLPACTVPRERGARPLRSWHYPLAVFLPFLGVIPGGLVATLLRKWLDVQFLPGVG